MSDTMNLNVRISGSLKEYVQREVSEGDYESASEYVRDLIRRDKNGETARQRAAMDELRAGFAAPDSDFIEVSADDIRKRVRERHSL